MCRPRAVGSEPVLVAARCPALSPRPRLTQTSETQSHHATRHAARLAAQHHHGKRVAPPSSCSYWSQRRKATRSANTSWRASSLSRCICACHVSVVVMSAKLVLRVRVAEAEAQQLWLLACAAGNTTSDRVLIDLSLCVALAWCLQEAGQNTPLIAGTSVHLAYLTVAPLRKVRVGHRSNPTSHYTSSPQPRTVLDHREGKNS